jgi:hypothetical protein
MMESLLNGKKGRIRGNRSNVRDGFVGLVETMRTTNSTSLWSPTPPYRKMTGNVAIRRDDPARSTAAGFERCIPNFSCHFQDE